MSHSTASTNMSIMLCYGTLRVYFAKIGGLRRVVNRHAGLLDLASQMRAVNNLPDVFLLFSLARARKSSWRNVVTCNVT